MNELRRIHRGLICMREAMGWQFTAAVVAVMLLLVIAVTTVHGAFIGILALLLALLAIRGHDLGEDAMPDTDTDTETLDDSIQAHLEQARKALEERDAAAAAQVKFLKQRGSVELGPPHEPKEL